MKSSFAARRKARRIGREDAETAPVNDEITTSNSTSEVEENTPVVKRPAITSMRSSIPKKKSSLRLSFGPGEASNAENGGAASEIFTPKKSNLSRQAIEKNAVRKSLASLSSDHLPIRQTDERPSYSKDHLNELKSSTPSTPKDIKSLSDIEDDTSKALDISAKFGSEIAIQQNSTIPTEAEIKEKKQRRARLAKERDFISLSDDEPSNTISLLPRKEKPESRLVRDDEDLGEGFDDFVEDGKISLGRKAEREQKRKHKAEMRDLINEAEGGSSDEDSDDSEVERKAEYEAAQTRKGMEGLEKGDTHGRASRPKTPPKITPLPSLASCLERLQATLSQMEYARMQNVRRMEEIEKEKAEIATREVEIQRLLKEAGENYEKLRAEAGNAANEDLASMATRLNGSNGIGNMNAGRGLESLGNTPIANTVGD